MIIVSPHASNEDVTSKVKKSTRKGKVKDSDDASAVIQMASDTNSYLDSGGVASQSTGFPRPIQVHNHVIQVSDMPSSVQ